MNRSVRIALAAAVLGAAAYAAFALTAPPLWNSPDETAVAYFSRIFGETGRLWAFEPMNAFAEERVHPRSIVSVDAHLVPASFYGMMWVVGFAYRFVGPLAFSLVTPVATGFAALAVFFLLRRPLGARTAVVAEALFLMHPAVWYFSSRGLFPNALFLDCVILGVAALHLRPWERFARGRGRLGASIDDALGVLLLSLAFAVRPIEFLWLGPLLVAWAIARRAHFTVTRVLAGALVVGLMLVAILVTNASLYGAPGSFGYTAFSPNPGVSVPALSLGSRLPEILSAPRPYVLPFGFHPRLAATNLGWYAVGFAWWYAAAAIAGVFFFPRRHLRRALVVLAFVALTLGIYYGSGVFSDSTVPGLTVGSSYLRYFLPIAALVLPFAAAGVTGVAGLAGRRSAAGFTGAFLALMFAANAWTVIWRSPESLAPMRAHLVRYQAIKSDVLARTAPRDLIVVERADKLFFPDRPVTLDLRDPATLDALVKLSLATQPHYFGITISDDEYPAIQGALAVRGLQMGRVRAYDHETLYAITPLE